MAGYDFKSEEDVKLFLKNLHTEYTFGCYSEKKPEVCHLLGDYQESIKKEFADAAKIYQKNCDNLDYGRSCAKFGGWSLVGKGCEKNVVMGFEYLKRGCELDDMTGCANAGIIGVSSPEVQKEDRPGVIKAGIDMLAKSCENKTEKACFFLAGLYYRGIEGVVEKNIVNSYKYSLQACEMGNPYACANVSQLHLRGEGGIEKNPKMAEIFKKRAIELEKDIKEYRRQIKFGPGMESTGAAEVR